MKKFMQNVCSLAFEDVTEEAPTTSKEHEIVIYAKIGDVNGLLQARDKEAHEQWEIKTPKGRVRIRKTTKGDLSPSFDLTFKTKSVEMGVQGNIEKTFEIDSEMFESFKALSDQGMIKERFLFPVQSVKVSNDAGMQDIHVEGMDYEVDVFYTIDEQGNKTYKPWCKIDLEIDPLIKQIETNHSDIGKFTLLIKAIALPFNPSDMLLSTDEDVNVKEQITRLYDEFFLTKK